MSSFTTSAASLTAPENSPKDTALDWATVGLQMLASISGVPYLTFGAGPFLKLIFPGSSDQSQQIEQSLTKISDQLTTMQSTINTMESELSASITKSSLANTLNSFTDEMCNYQTHTQECINQIKQIESLPDGSDAKKAQEMAFLRNQYYAGGLDSSSDFCSSVIDLRQMLTKTYYSDTSQAYNIFGTFDEYTRYSLPWEHQGYLPRTQFREYIFGIYTTLDAVAQACLAYAAENKLTPNSSGVDPQAQLATLQQTTRTVSETLKSQETVAERPSYQRYYQIPGHECLLANTSDTRHVDQIPSDAYNSIISQGKAFMDAGPVEPTNVFQYFNNYLNSHQYPNVYTNQSIGLTNTLPTSDWLKQVYADYGNSTPLFDAFFGKNEGNLPVDQSLINSGARFITNGIDVNIISPESTEGYDYLGYKDSIMKQDFSVKATAVDSSANSLLYCLATGYAEYDGNDNEDLINNTADTGDHFIGLSVLHQGVTPVDFDAVSITSVHASNGSVSVTLNSAVPTVLSDFTAQYSVDGGAAQPIPLTGISGSGASYTLAFDKIPITSKSHSVVITVSYGGKAVSAPAFTVKPAAASFNGTYYASLQEALTAAAGSGGTVTLLDNETESDTVTVPSGKVVTIDGGNKTVTAPDNSNGSSVALTVSGAGTLTLKNITLQGGAAVENSSGNSFGLYADSGFSGSILSQGTVDANGGSVACHSDGVRNDGGGAVTVTAAKGGTGNIIYSNGAELTGTGVINAKTATGGNGSSQQLGTCGVSNNGAGTVNVGTAMGGTFVGGNNGGSYGVYIGSNGTVNADTATGGASYFTNSYGVFIYGSGTANISTATGGTYGDLGEHDSYGVYSVSGNVNVGTAKGETVDTGGNGINTNVSTVALHAGAGATCVLDCLTVAASGNTYVGTLPAVYDATGSAGEWFTDPNHTAKASSPLSNSVMNLYSTFYTACDSDISAVPIIDDIMILNNVGSTDTVTVKNLAAGDTVSVYDTAAGGKLLTRKTFKSDGGSGSVTMNLTLAPSGGSIYVTKTNARKNESDRVRGDYAAESACSSTSTAPLASFAVIRNPHTGDNNPAGNCWPLMIALPVVFGMALAVRRRHLRFKKI